MRPANLTTLPPRARAPLTHLLLIAATTAVSAPTDPGATQRRVSGIHPHLAMLNDEGECGTGAVVPWADRLWVITYGPHLPHGSSDKLYEIAPDLTRVIRPESVGGTPANRMIHAESRQLFIGPYVIDEKRAVRVIPPRAMPGRLTGNARHLTDPTGKIYFATMEEGLYEVDVQSLAVTGLIRDGNRAKPGTTQEVHPATIDSQLPGYHGKGLFSGQGRVVYANNGEHGKRALTDPTIPSGALGEWRGQGDWQLVRRAQFTEVTGPGGIRGPEHPDTDPLWSVGWDHRSLILMLLDRGRWHAFRLPKASHCYDGAHGWNTEWPRIRDVGSEGAPDLLMTMHGAFWRFPRGFASDARSGITMRSTYLKVVGDFCRWRDEIVFGCDDAAKSEFLNRRPLKGTVAGPGRSQSNLWFVSPDTPDRLGPALGRGGPWLDDTAKAGEPSEPYLFAGFERRSLHLSTGNAARVTLEIDARGDGAWTPLREIVTAPDGIAWIEFDREDPGVWIRLKPDRDLTRATAFFQYSNPDLRPARHNPIFDGIARRDTPDGSAGLIHAGAQTLRFAARLDDGSEACYALDASLTLRRAGDARDLAWMREHVAIPNDALRSDAASVILEEDGALWRLPLGDPGVTRAEIPGEQRLCREVCTERDLLHAAGTFYELPARNAGGLRKVRPIATHTLRVADYCSYRGMLVMSGVAATPPDSNPRIVRSDDGRCALWLGAIDDLWALGKPRGVGGPWRDSATRANEPSDPYLMTGYDKKRLVLSHSANAPVAFVVQADFCGTGAWTRVRELEVPPGQPLEHRFPDAFAAYWIRLVPKADCRATATFHYE